MFFTHACSNIKICINKSKILCRQLAIKCIGMYVCTCLCNTYTISGTEFISQICACQSDYECEHF